MKRTVFYCPKCGGTNVSVRAWVDANTDELVADIDDDGTGRCEDCNNEIRLAERVEDDEAEPEPDPQPQPEENTGTAKYHCDPNDPLVIDAGRPMAYAFDIEETRFRTVYVKASTLAEARAFVESLYERGRISLDGEDPEKHETTFCEMFDYDPRTEYEPEIEEMRKTLGKMTRDCIGAEAVRHLAHGGRCEYKHGLWNGYGVVTAERAAEILKKRGCAWSWSKNGECVGFHELRWGKGKEGEEVLQIAEYGENELY